MRLTISVSDGQLLNIDVSDSLTLADLKAYIQAETDIEPLQQKLKVDGKLLTSETLSIQDLGLKEDDLLVLEIAQESVSIPDPSSTSTSTRTQANNNSGSNFGFGSTSAPSRVFSPEEAEFTRKQLLENQELVTSLKRFRPNISSLLSNQDDFLRYASTNLESDLRTESMALQMNPDDPENQARILQLIRQEQIDRNYELAHDITPEAFTSISMLYVRMLVNGHEVVAFVDTGAQVSIISPKIAETVGISHLIDKRFRGVAVGVGKLQIDGKIHSVPIGFPNSTVELPTSFTVIDGQMEVLLGLDMMRRHKCVVDLERNVLVMGGCIDLPFLSDYEIEQLLGNRVFGFNHAESQTESEPAPKRKATAPRPAASVSRPVGSGSSSSSVSGNTNTARSFAEKDIKTLVDLGFTRSDAIRALHQSKGNVDVAASMLFQ